jgi:hypothetical protein
MDSTGARDDGVLSPFTRGRADMDKADLILAAIEQLARGFDARIESARTSIDAKIESVRVDLKADVARLDQEMKAEFRVVHARLDEQRQTINALIPQRIAAVGRGTDAAE